MPVDLLGKCVDYDAVGTVAAEATASRCWSDAAESLGATWRGRPAAFGDAAILSFNGNKIMTTSGGGMLLTDDAALADQVRYLSTQAREPAEHYEHTEIGYNYRLSNMLGCARPRPAGPTRRDDRSGGGARGAAIAKLFADGRRGRDLRRRGR